MGANKLSYQILEQVHAISNQARSIILIGTSFFFLQTLILWLNPNRFPLVSALVVIDDMDVTEIFSLSLCLSLSPRGKDVLNIAP